MDRLEVDTAQNVSLDLPLAGIGDRIAATLVDFLVLGAYGIVVLNYAAIAKDLTTTVVLILPMSLYFLACEVFLDGQSVGKRYMNIKVVRADGTAASVGNYVVRWLLRPIDFHLTSGAGALVTLFITGTGQRLGDLAAGTTVVKVDEQTSARDLTYAEVDADYTPRFPEVRRLSDDDLRTARRVLEALDRTNRRDLGPRTQRALEQKMGVSSDLAPKAFLETLLKDHTQVHGHQDR